MNQYLLEPIVQRFRNRSHAACERKAKELLENVRWLRAQVANIGGGAHCAIRWPQASSIDACVGRVADFNTQPLPYKDDSQHVVICEQVIEHLHNTRWFLNELRRILRLGGRLILTTENLLSIPNMCAMLIGMAPFSLQNLDGFYCGGWKKGSTVRDLDWDIPLNHPAHSGVTGHVRVMTTRQLAELLRERFSYVRKWGFGLNHYILFECIP